MDINLEEKKAWKKYWREQGRKKAQNHDLEIIEKQYLFPSFVLWVCILAASLIAGCNAKSAHAEPVDLKIIAQIESSNNPKAHSPRDGAGLYQITPIALKEYNNHNAVKYTMIDMYDVQKCRAVAAFMFHVAIPKMIKRYGKAVTLRNKLIAYNAGVSYVRDGKKLPLETVNYLKRYTQLARAGR